MAHRYSYTSSLADRAVLAGFAVSLCCVTIPAAPAVSGFLRRSAAFSIWVGGFGHVHGPVCGLQPVRGAVLSSYMIASPRVSGPSGAAVANFGWLGSFGHDVLVSGGPGLPQCVPRVPCAVRLVGCCGHWVPPCCSRACVLFRCGVPPPCSGGPNALRRLPLPDHTPAAYVGVGPGPGGSLWAPGPKLRLVVPVTRCRFLGEIFGFAC